MQTNFFVWVLLIIFYMFYSNIPHCCLYFGGITLIWENIYKAHSLLRLKGVSILSVSAPTIFSVLSLLEIESVSILTVSAPTEKFLFYLLAWPHCISSRVCHLPPKNVYFIVRSKRSFCISKTPSRIGLCGSQFFLSRTVIN